VPPEDKNTDEVDRTVNDVATQQFWNSALRAWRRQLVAIQKGEKIKNTSQSDIKSTKAYEHQEGLVVSIVLATFLKN